MKLDQIDLEILYYLQNDSRISLTLLGKNVNLTPAAITYRLQKLTKNNIIKNFTIELNYQKLTPNYQAYAVNANVSNDRYEETVKAIQKTGIFNQILRVASSLNFLGITKPISSHDLNLVTNLFNSKHIVSFSLVPIIEGFEEDLAPEIVGENISKLYCPECQDYFEGRAVVSQVRENQIMGFCCKECRVNFLEKYTQIK